MTTIMWVGKCKDEIIVRDDKNKDKNVQSKDKVEYKDRDDIRKIPAVKAKL